MLAKIGDVEIWRVLEDVAPLLPLARFFPDLTAEMLGPLRAGLADQITADAQTGEDWLVLPIQAFLLRTPRRLILVDACVGNDKTVVHIPHWSNRRSARFLSALTAAGAAPEDVDLVCCTHLHVDHVGWTTRRIDGAWVPTFPNARVLTTQADLDFAQGAAAAQPDSTIAQVWAQTLAPLIAAGRIDVVAPDAELDPAVRLMPTPGHTPGHVSVLIAGDGREAEGAAVTGDLMHSPLQCAHPDLCPVVDIDKPLARATRRAFMERSAETGRLTLATHFPLPSAGRIEAAGPAFRWRAVI